ncbi:rhomboid family intramembrane serine protease [Sphingomonas ginsenosidivorax]|uniref:Rhomboid family intramembrane serine protease n=1 Tax=Sphingomonas ginsenosidivorax TaxID=862135 RepID=A0A5C6UFT9_9SPHN|nr:rhomboid family intramembrane serine protease [Sphingomonas ginsenosidivorax]TXC71121.1 rhomboid family intramembrane serine protease [Sphingomonas ginsenosidivorax]
MRFFEARATAILTIATLVVSGLILLTGSLPWWAVNAGFIPLRVDAAFAAAAHNFAVPMWATPLTATFVHGGVAHVAFNMVMLAFCGLAVERAIGSAGVVVLYVVGAYAAALGHWAFGPHSVAPMIGASGAISAIVGAYALLYGERQAKALGPVPAGVVHVAWLAAAWIGIQLLTGLAGFGSGAPIAIGAHIGGFVAGLILARPLLLWKYRAA